MLKCACQTLNGGNGAVGTTVTIAGSTAHAAITDPSYLFDLVVAGTKDAVMMVESEAYELSEAEMLGAVKFGHEQMQPVIDLIISLAEEAAKDPFDFTPPDYSAIYDAVKATGEEQMRAAYAITDKQQRVAAVAAAKEAIKASLSEEQLEDENLGSALKKLESVILRSAVVKEGKRIDGRALDAVAPDRPVLLIASSGHEALVNPYALELAGIDATTPDPPGGAAGPRRGALPAAGRRLVSAGAVSGLAAAAVQSGSGRDRRDISTVAGRPGKPVSTASSSCRVSSIFPRRS